MMKYDGITISNKLGVSILPTQDPSAMFTNPGIQTQVLLVPLTKQAAPSPQGECMQGPTAMAMVEQEIIACQLEDNTEVRILHSN